MASTNSNAQRSLRPFDKLRVQDAKPSRPKIKRYPDGITRAVLPNGLTVIAKEMHASTLYFYQ